MPVKLSAIIFKTNQLRETRIFFETTLGFAIKESSTTHFTIFTRSVRIVFLQSDQNLGIDLYAMNKNVRDLGPAAFSIFKDPNGMRIVVCNCTPGNAFKKVQGDEQ